MNIFRTLSIGTRIVAIGLIASSPWLKPVKRWNADQAIVYVVDRSASMGDDSLTTANEYLQTAWKAHRREKVGLVAFGGHAEVLAEVGTKYLPDVKSVADGNATDLAGAIRLAVASLPVEGHRSIVVLSDFRPTRGDAEAEVRRASAAGIRVDVVPLDAQAATTSVVTALKPRAGHVAEHQPVAFDADVHVSGPFTIDWTRDGVPMASKQVYNVGTETHEDGSATVESVDPDPPPGVHVYEAHAEEFRGWGGGRRAHHDPDDAPPPTALTAVSVEGKPYAAVFSSSGDVPAVLQAALTEAGLDVRRLPTDSAADPSTYSGAGLVVLADVRVSAAEKDDTGLTRAAQTALIDYVQQGGGLLTTGGVFGLAPEYANTPIARAIPVEIEDRGHVEDPPVSLAIMLDRSGSMAAMVGNHTKIELAIEASLGAAEVLRPTDFVAIASVDTQTHWDVPLGPQARLADLRDGVRQVGAGGGGIYVYTALKDAYEALKDSTTPIRHVILFSDTADSEQQSEDCESSYGGACNNRGKTAEKLAKEARVKGITTTVVGIGEESASDTPFLRRLAASAGGRFYITAEGTDFRRIFTSETRVLAQSNLREQKVKVAPTGPHPALEGVSVSKLPPLAAYVETGRRPGADTALVLPDGRPLLATWRYGLGKSGVIATDFSEGWGADWAGSPAAAQLLRQSLRFLLRQSDARRADASVAIKDRQVEVDIQLPLDAPASSAPAALDVFAVEKSGTSHKVEMHLESVGPGHWVARGRSNGEPVVIARARDSRGALMAEALGREDRTPELSGKGVDAYYAGKLASAGDGRVEPTPEASLAPTPSPAKALVATWPFALVGSAFLVMLDLLFRRLGERTPTKRGAPARIDQRDEQEPLRAAA